MKLLRQIKRCFTGIPLYIAWRFRLGCHNNVVNSYDHSPLVKRWASIMEIRARRELDQHLNARQPTAAADRGL